MLTKVTNMCYNSNMSMNSPESGNESLTPDQLEQARQEREEDRITNGARPDFDDEFVSPPGSSRPKRVDNLPRRPYTAVRGYHDVAPIELPDSLEMPTEEEVEYSKKVIAELREQLGIGVVADLPIPEPRAREITTEEAESNILPSEIRSRRELGNIARQLAMDTGLTHRVVKDEHGHLVVEPVSKKNL